MKMKSWQEMEKGVVNRLGGNNLKERNGYASKLYMKPLFAPTTCTQCLICWIFCPENAIILENNSVKEINYSLCKGCGICANECPVEEEERPLIMREEEKHT
jgi:pyruvate ferredoxin oxidoreductase delta subunit